MPDEPGGPAGSGDQRELAARLRAVIEAKDAENAMLRVELVTLLDPHAGLAEQDAGAPHILVVRTPHAGLTWLRALGSSRPPRSPPSCRSSPGS